MDITTNSSYEFHDLNYKPIQKQDNIIENLKSIFPNYSSNFINIVLENNDYDLEQSIQNIIDDEDREKKDIYEKKSKLFLMFENICSSDYINKVLEDNDYDLDESIEYIITCGSCEISNNFDLQKSIKYIEELNKEKKNLNKNTSLQVFKVKNNSKRIIFMEHTNNLDLTINDISNEIESLKYTRKELNKHRIKTITQDKEIYLISKRLDELHETNKMLRNEVKTLHIQQHNHKPLNTIDIHRLNKKDALTLIKNTLKIIDDLPQKNLFNNFTIITGRGNHSENGAILKPFVIKWCRYKLYEFEEFLGHIIINLKN